MPLKIKKKFLDKKVVVFDLDGTLTKSKSPLDEGMKKLFLNLLEKKKVAIIGGGRYEQFQNQFLKKLKAPARLLKNLFLFPANSTLFYRQEGGAMKKIYGHFLSAAQKKKIREAFKKAFQKIGYRHPKKTYGVIIEDRGSQITFSAAGQKAPLAVKEKWNKENDVRQALMKIMKKELPEFSVRSGGLTSIDVTKKGIDKAYGVRQIAENLGTKIKDMIFVGDALYPGGNDAAAKKTGIDCLQVGGPEETKEFIRKILSAGK